jgi:UDP-N-acetylglucosamine 2-epimerase (non-hydrolysing)
MKTILFIFGTRPEALKLIPLINEFKKNEDKFITKVCITSQHQEMLWQVLDFFETKPDYNLNIMLPNQTLFDLTSNGLKNLEKVLAEVKPDLVIVQGDTTSTFIGALAAFYYQIPVAHIEAGLRSGNKYSPFPEEINRKLVSQIADFHFAPTDLAMNNLLTEKIDKNVFVVGNTVIDSLFLTLDKIKNQNIEQNFPFIKPDSKLILVTGHRRESFGKPFENICNALLKIAKNFDDIQIVYPVHLNPNVSNPVSSILSGQSNISLIKPLNYPEFIWLMNKSYLILTDSGGVQEEAPSLGKPVLVMREVTERTEGIQAGTSKLIGTSMESIYNEVSFLLNNKKGYEQMSNIANPYGDGNSSKRIVEIIGNLL